MSTQMMNRRISEEVEVVDGEIFHHGLMCFVLGLEYDYRTRIGTLRLDGCCDMSGCLRLFQQIDPEVERIDTFWSGEPDTAYIRKGDKWIVRRGGHE